MENTEIIRIAKEEVSSKIELMRKNATELEMFYFGSGTDDFLAKINGYENEEQHKLRKKLAISLKSITEELLRQFDSVWSAKGGSVTINLKGAKKDKLQKALKDVRGGLSLRQFMNQIWFERFVVDPNGLIFLEVSEDGEKREFKYKSIHNIHAYDLNGIRPIWVLFEPYKVEVSEIDKKTVKTTYQWFVDADRYVLLKKVNGEYSIELEKPNIFGEVPGVVNSAIYNTHDNIKVSPIHNQSGLLKSYLVKNSVKEIHQFLHLYPIFWQYEQICPVCHGKRMVGGEVCSVCNGTGLTTRKDVSDVISLKKPEADETAIGAPAGYVSPDIATMGEQRTELEWIRNLLTFSLWGTTVEKAGNETATGRFIDIQPVNNRLNSVSDIAQQVETVLMNLIGKYEFEQTYEDGYVLYGRRFIIETPDQLMTRYLDAKAKLAPLQMLNWLLEQFYIAEFANDEQMADFYLKMMQVEPFVHESVEAVLAYPIEDSEKLMKLYFQNWVNSIDKSEIKTIDEYRKSLTEFITKKQLSYGKDSTT